MLAKHDKSHSQSGARQWPPEVFSVFMCDLKKIKFECPANYMILLLIFFIRATSHGEEEPDEWFRVEMVQCRWKININHIKNIKCEEPLVALEKDDHHYESTRPSVQLPRGSETEGHPAWAA